MSEDSEVVIETAKAVQQVSKTAGTMIDAAEKMGAFISRFIAGPLE